MSYEKIIPRQRKRNFRKSSLKASHVPTAVCGLYDWKAEAAAFFRVGISVGKKIGNAVARNWVKRRIRQVWLSWNRSWSKIVILS